jgi:hypothetical protein
VTPGVLAPPELGQSETQAQAPEGLHPRARAVGGIGTPGLRRELALREILIEHIERRPIER